MSKLFPQLQKTDSDRKRHIKALKALFAVELDHRLFEHFYSTLTILDAKSSSLLVFNGILIAVFAVFVPTEMPFIDRVILNCGMASILVSCALLLLVVLVRWTSTPDLAEKEHYENLLLQLRNARTVKYFWGWCCSILAMICLCVFIFFHQYPGEKKPAEAARPAAAQG